MGWSKSGQCSCQDAAGGPAPAKFLFIFMRAKIVCFRVVCWYFVDATEVSFRGRGACFAVMGGTCRRALVCGGAPEGNICPSPGLTVSKHEAFGGPLLFVPICISFLSINKDLAI